MVPYVRHLPHHSDPVTNSLQDEKGASEEHDKACHHREGAHDLAQKPLARHCADVAWYNVAEEGFRAHTI